MIHPNFDVKRFTFIFWHFILFATSSNVHPAPKWLCHQFIIHKTKYETTFFKKWLWHSSYTKIHIIFSKCDNVIENIQIHMSWQVFFFLVWKFAQMWKINMIREFFKKLWSKKSSDLKKLKIVLWHFPIGFGLVTIF
jgi:hypothetical protein